jgi:hypothetical protein
MQPDELFVFHRQTAHNLFGFDAELDKLVDDLGHRYDVMLATGSVMPDR